MKPGPKPSKKCRPEGHIRYPEDVREILDSMGPGTPQDKLIHIAREYGKGKNQKTKLGLLADLEETTIKSCLIGYKVTMMEEQLQTQFGCTDNEISDFHLKAIDIAKKQIAELKGDLKYVK